MIYSFVCTYSVNVRNFLELHIARYISFWNLRCILVLAHIYKTSFRLVRRLDNTITFGTFFLIKIFTWYLASRNPHKPFVWSPKGYKQNWGFKKPRGFQK